jgi:hypothetical protein
MRPAMRHSNQLARGRRLPFGAAGLAMSALVAVLVACGGSAAPSASASPAPTPVITPDPHLSEPVTADKIFIVLGIAKLGITANNADAETGDPGIIKLINADIGNWPLRITQFSSSEVLRKRLAWKAGGSPRGDEAPYNIVGLNILIQYGPISAASPATPDAARQATAAQIVSVLDPLLWPLSQRSVVQVPSRTPAPTAAPSVSVAPSAPAKSPKPTVKPTAKPSHKP